MPYDWSQLGTVRQTVVGSNALEHGSTWELIVAPRDGGGSIVQTTFDRRFRARSPGRHGPVLNHLIGRRGFGWMLRSVAKA